MKVKRQLQALGKRPRKDLGQNFLIDQFALQEIIMFGRPNPADQIVEIGPGLGALTTYLAKYPNLSLIEIEPEFCAELARKFPAVKIIESDVRLVDFSQFGSNLLVFGNVPYSFSTDILFHLVGQSGVVKRAILLLQKEFAERVAAPPGSRTYGSLSVSVQLVANARLGPIIGGRSFHPPTKVESQVLELTFLPQPRFAVPSRIWFNRVVHMAFAQRRKKLANSLKAPGVFVPGIVDAALERCGIDPGRRAEMLSLAEFVKLSEELPDPQAAMGTMAPPT